MHCHRRNRLGNSRPQGDDARNIGRLKRLAHAAKNDFINPAWVEARPGEQRVDGDAPQFVRAGPREIGAHFTKGRADSVHDDQSLGLHLASSRVSAALASWSDRSPSGAWVGPDAGPVLR